MRGTTALVFAPEDFAQLFQIRLLWHFVVGPFLVLLHFGLQTPAALIFNRPHFAFFALFRTVGPSVKIAHGSIDHFGGFFGKAIDAGRRAA